MGEFRLRRIGEDDNTQNTPTEETAPQQKTKPPEGKTPLRLKEKVDTSFHAVPAQPNPTFAQKKVEEHDDSPSYISNFLIGLMLIIVGTIVAYIAVYFPYQQVHNQVESVTFHRKMGAVGILLIWIGFENIITFGRKGYWYQRKEKRMTVSDIISTIIILIILFKLHVHIEDLLELKGYK